MIVDSQLKTILSDYDYQTCVEMVSEAHRHLRRVLNGSGLGDPKKILAEVSTNASADTPESGVSEQVARALETSAFPTDHTQDLAWNSPALVVSWLKRGLDDVRAVAQCTETTASSAVRESANAYLQVADKAIEYLNTAYKQTTDNEDYWDQQGVMELEEAVMISETIYDLWSSCRKEPSTDEEWTDLCSFLHDNHKIYPVRWDQDRKNRILGLLQKGARGKTSSKDESWTALTRELQASSFGLSQMSRGPVDHLRKATRARTCALDMVDKVLKVPSKSCLAIASRQQRLRDALSRAEAHRNRAGTYRSRARNPIDTKSDTQEASQSSVG